MAKATVSRSDIARLLPRALDRSAGDGARIVALHWVFALDEARGQWAECTADPFEAPSTSPAVQTTTADAAASLHRARVALRRLRATLREHRTLMRVSAKVSASLQALNRATNSARDADVQRAWLGAEAESLLPAARREARRRLKERGRQITRDRHLVSEAFVEHLDPIVERLVKRLASYTEHRTVGQTDDRPTFAAQLAIRVARGAATIEAMLTAQGGMDEPEHVLASATLERLHVLRILLKRQRAMLAPFTRADSAIAAWYDIATRGQDALGAMRDASVFATDAARHGMRALEFALRDVSLGHFASFQRAWCADPDMIARVAAASRAAVDALDAIVASNALPREIERKYLLRGVPPAVMSVAPSRIEQGWLPGVLLRERLRRTTRPDGTVRLTRTVKAGALGSRIELEENTESALFDSLWPHTRAARIRKDRHAISAGGFVWEIDVFLDRELVLAEVELTDAANVPAAPEWLAPWIVRDVTDEPDYTNSSMAACLPDPSAMSAVPEQRSSS